MPFKRDWSLSQKATDIEQVEPYKGDSVVAPEYNNSTITQKIANIVLRAETPLWWYLALAFLLPVVGLSLIHI